MRIALGALRRMLREAVDDHVQKLADLAGVEPIDVETALRQHASQNQGDSDWVFHDDAAQAAIVRSAQQAQADRVQRSRHSRAAHQQPTEKS